ncbi:MAG: 3-hydroxyacyl-CoA dehydrogenase family protein [Planctomycetaceae bacterium]|nr:3-hydroxyacyl-CoA dehydrogenase family protein [Planctomycetaceae bacterium]
MPNATCAVVGTGLMGVGIATAYARHGHEVLVYDADPERLREVPKAAKAVLDEMIRTGRFPADQADATLARLHPVSELSRLADCTLVHEAIPERLDLKIALYRQLEEVLQPDAVIASNTSGLPPDDLSAEMSHPERLLIAHFYNPPHFVPLVEVVPGSKTERRHLTRVFDLIKGLDLEAVLLERACPGFVGNRLQFALLREALHIVQAGITSADMVDLVIRSVFGRRFPMIGQLEVADMGGLDTFMDISRHLWPQLCKDESPLELLEEKVAGGHTGIRSGEGFYVWDDARRARVAERREHLMHTALKPS